MYRVYPAGTKPSPFPSANTRAGAGWGAVSGMVAGWTGAIVGTVAGALSPSTSCFDARPGRTAVAGMVLSLLLSPSFSACVSHSLPDLGAGAGARGGFAWFRVQGFGFKFNGLW